MKLNQLLTSGLAVGLLLACPALAQTARAPVLAMNTVSEGTAEVRGLNGFVLVEHGAWARSRAPAPAPQHAPVKNAGSSPFRSAARLSLNQNEWRRTIYMPQILAAEARYALPTGLLDALVWAESRYNPLAVSSAGAAGLGQLMPHTAAALGVTNRFDPGTNILGAARYLRQMLDRFGMVHLAVAAYNAGPRAVERAGGIPNNGETPDYVREVLRNWR